MRAQALHYLLVVACLILLARCWTKEDHEIFRLRDEVEASEGADVSFYDFIGVPASATWDDINKAFRKKSRQIHPDKVRQNFIATRSTKTAKKSGDKKKPGVHVSKGPSKKEIDTFMKDATARYSRLGVVTTLLKGAQRERYDHFLRHGFPAWRGTGYYYARYRPGLGTVLTGLFVVGGGVAHYYALKISYNGQRQFMEKYIKHARKSAWGSETGIAGIPGVAAGPVDVPQPVEEEPDPYANLNRRQKREMEKQNKKDKSKGSVKPSAGRVLGTGESVTATSPQGQRKRVTAENGKQLLVDSVGNVFLVEEIVDEETGEVTTEEFLLDLDDIHKPTIYDTAVVKLPLWLWRKAFDPFLKSTAPVPDNTVPRTEEEVEAEAAKVVLTKDSTPEVSMPASMSASQDFEMIDSSSIPPEASGNGNRRKAKKGKK